jgi:xanthine dehydrogenase accessory factor
VEVLIEPQQAPLVLAVVGDAPAARTLRELAGVLGWRVTNEIGGADAVVVATMGRDDEVALEAALAGDAGYIGLVASARRAASLGLDEESRARVRSPAGLDLGPSSQEEIAVAILAELVAWRHTRSQDVLVEYATDPICGMSVAVVGAEHTLEHEGAIYYFCGAHCRKKFEAALV